jgi:hypothetical protein
MQHQVRSETLGGVLAFEAASRELVLSDAWIIMRNVAVGALAALRKGCSSSSFLQQCSIRFTRLQHAARYNMLYLHAPGTVLVEEGVDDLSRETAADVAGLVSGTLVRAHVLRLAASLGWKLTVDAFASEANSLLPRFFARYAEPRAEAEDASSVGNWACSTCPACQQSHGEVLFTFLPSALLNRFVAKARSDGIRAVVVTPLAVSAPYWSKLFRASVVDNDAGYIRIRKQAAAPLDSDVAGELAVLALDFSPWSTRRPATATVARCGLEASFRGRNPLGSPADQADRARIRAQLVQLGLALR